MFSIIEKVYAQSSSLGGTADTYLTKIKTEILQPIIYLLFAFAVLYFLYGVFLFIRDAGSPEKREEGGMHILWGVIGMFIMISVYGIINLVLNTIAN